MTEISVVERLHRDFQDLSALLQEEPSLRISADDVFRKGLLIAAASSFEVQVGAAILSFVEQATSSNALIRAFVQQKALSRNYHSLFQWESTYSGANQFFALFGESFKRFMKEAQDCDDELANAVRDFLEVGRERNRLVHGDFGNYTLEKTAQEIFELYESGQVFVDSLCPKLIECSETHTMAIEVDRLEP